MLITGISTVSEKGQLVIPRDIRQALHVKRGDRLTWTIDEDSGEIRVALASTDLMALRGKICSGGKSVSIADMDNAIKSAAGSDS